MDNKDWYDCGAKIGDLVNSAINSSNYRQLNEAITDTINDTIDAIQKNAAKQSQMRSQAQEAVRQQSSWRREGNLYEQARGRRHFSPGKEPKGTFSLIFGYVMGLVFGGGAVSFALLLVLTKISFFIVPMVFFLILTVICAMIGRRGARQRSLGRAADQYLRVMGQRDTVTIDELAVFTGKSRNEVCQELRQIIRAGIFPGEACLDEQKTVLMTSTQAYRQYREAGKAAGQPAKRGTPKEQGAGEKNQQEQIRREAEKQMSAYSDETRNILEEGKAFITHIHEANEVITDAEMSTKLDRLETVVTRIFEQVARKPDSAPDLHRMMSYYLPITRKLVDAYIELDKQKIQGENITRTRREIEASLDTINGAFEIFLDSFFQDTAWDIESDINALHAMMARDGLTGSDFVRAREHAAGVGDDLAGAGAAARQEDQA